VAPQREACILMYHSLTGEPGAYDVPPALFEAHLDALADAGARVVPVGDVAAGAAPEGEGPVVAITFDDAHATVAEVAAPLLAVRGWPACVYTVSGWLDRPDHLAAEALRDLAAAGWTVGSHGATHDFLAGLGAADLAAELEGSRAALSEASGTDVVHLALPGGRGGRREADAARGAGYHSLATSRTGMAQAGGDPFALPRIAIGPGTRADDLRKAIAGKWSFHGPARARQWVLDAGKRALGDERYHRLWKRLRGQRA